MFLTASQFDNEANIIAHLLFETENARYFHSVKSIDGKPHLSNSCLGIVDNYIEKGHGLAICDTSIKREGTINRVFCPCFVTNDGSYSYSAIQFNNIFFYGSDQDKLLLKAFFNAGKSIRNIILEVKHLSIDKIFEIISMLNFASIRMDMDYFRFDELGSTILFADENIIVSSLINSMKYKIYERYTNRPGRDDHFDLLKGIMNVPKNEYFRKLVLESTKGIPNVSELSSVLRTEFDASTEDKVVANIVLKHDSGWTVFPKPTDNIEHGQFKIDQFVIEIIKKFNKYEFLLEELKINSDELPNLWTDEESMMLLRIMKQILIQKIERKHFGWTEDESIKSLVRELRTKLRHFGYAFRIGGNSYFKDGKLKANFFIKHGGAMTVTKYLETNRIGDVLNPTVFVPIAYQENIEKFFQMDPDTHKIYTKFKNITSLN